MNRQLQDIPMNEVDDENQMYQEYIDQGLDHKQAMGLLYDKPKHKLKTKKTKNDKFMDGDI